MKKAFKRNLLFNMNRFQATIILPVLLIMVLIQIMLGVLFYLSINETTILLKQFNSKTIIYQQSLVKYKNFLPIFIAAISLLVFSLAFWTLYISNKILGPHERIIRELDEMIEGKREKKALYARPNDKMFEELLYRVNILIEKCSFDKKIRI